MIFCMPFVWPKSFKMIEVATKTNTRIGAIAFRAPLNKSPKTEAEAAIESAELAFSLASSSCFTSSWLRRVFMTSSTLRPLSFWMV